MLIKSKLYFCTIMCLFTDAHTHKICDDPSSMGVLNVGLSLLTDGTWLSAGIHPWDIADNQIVSDVQLLEDNLKRDARIVAIGECGLDALHFNAGIKVQMALFEAQLKLALDYHLPVIVHCVKAYPQLLVLLKKLNFNLPVILHSPRVDALQMSYLSDFDVFYSLGPLSINWNNSFEMISKIPADRLLCETDDSDYSIVMVFEQIAAITNRGVNSLKSSVFENFMKAYTHDGRRKMV